MMKSLGDGIVVGPLLLGTAKPAHVLIPSVTSRGIVNAAAYASASLSLLEKTAGKPKNRVARLKTRRS
jgi:hypothetical protein